MLVRPNYTSMTPIHFRRQTTFIMGSKRQKSTISEKTEKKSKSRQKSWFFKEFWLLWLLTSMRDIIPQPVPDRCSFWKKLKIFQKSGCGDKIFKKVDFWPPPTGQKVTKEWFNRHGTKKLTIFSTNPGRMQKFREFYWEGVENLNSATRGGI